jgi:hypothetical protein
MRILVDMDGVLTDLEGGFLEQRRERHPGKPTLALSRGGRLADALPRGPDHLQILRLLGDFSIVYSDVRLGDTRYLLKVLRKSPLKRRLVFIGRLVKSTGIAELRCHPAQVGIDSADRQGSKDPPEVGMA